MRYHLCPGCRSIEVPSTMLACLPCWKRLPKVIRDEVRATRRYPITHQRRRDALTAALAEFRNQQAPNQVEETVKVLRGLGLPFR